MNIDLKKIIPNFILLIGYLAFILLAFNNNLIYAIILLTSILIFFVLYGLLLNVFDVYIFAWAISFSGLLIAISILCIFGIEEVPYPVGAFILHSEGLAGALGIGLFSIFPIIMITQLNTINKNTTTIKESSNISTSDLKTEMDDNNWEIATEDDLLSGEFEIP